MNDIMAIFKLNSSLYCPVVRSRSLINVWNERKFFFIVFFRWTVHKPNINSPGILFVPHWTFESESWHPVPSCDHQVPNRQRQGFLTLQGETHVQVHHHESVIITFTCMHKTHFGIYCVHNYIYIYVRASSYEPCKLRLLQLVPTHTYYPSSPFL